MCNFSSGNVGQRHHFTFQLNRARRFGDMNLRRVSSFFLHFYFFFLSRFESCYKTQKHYPIALKFCTLKGGIKVHPDTKVACNTINGYQVINNYLQKKLHQYVVTPTGLTTGAENRQADRVASNLLLFKRN